MDWQLDIHRTSGVVTDTIEDDYGRNKARKTHEVLVEGRPTSTLSKQHYHELMDIFCPAYLNRFINEGLLKDLYLVCSQIEETGMDRVERQQKEYELEEAEHLESEGEHEINFEIKDVFDLLRDNGSARELLYRWLNRQRNVTGKP
jgi:hypothetical protein